VCGSQALEPNIWATATLTASSDSLSPTVKCVTTKLLLLLQQTELHSNLSDTSGLYILRAILNKGFCNFIFCKALLGVDYLWCREYVRNPTVALTTHTLIKLI